MHTCWIEACSILRYFKTEKKKEDEPKSLRDKTRTIEPHLTKQSACLGSPDLTIDGFYAFEKR